MSKPAAPLTKKHAGALDESWSKVHAIEHAERRRFDPLIKRFAVLSDERLESILFSIQQPNDSKPWMKVLVPDLLFELAWVSDLRRAEGSAEEDYLWEDIKRLIAQRQRELGEAFRFALWTLYVGRKVGEAWLCRDGKFFERHADLWRALGETSDETESRADEYGKDLRYCDCSLRRTEAKSHQERIARTSGGARPDNRREGLAKVLAKMLPSLFAAIEERAAETT